VEAKRARLAIVAPHLFDENGDPRPPFVALKPTALDLPRQLRRLITKLQALEQAWFADPGARPRIDGEIRRIVTAVDGVDEQDALTRVFERAAEVPAPPAAVAWDLDLRLRMLGLSRWADRIRPRAVEALSKRSKWERVAALSAAVRGRVGTSAENLRRAAARRRAKRRG
jgi:hypothetical protein